MALLCYLAVKREAIHRNDLAELLWGLGRYHNLRQALLKLRQLQGADVWLKNNDSPRVVTDCDVHRFSEAVFREHYEDALELWRGPFLEGFALQNTPAFLDWQNVERQRLEMLYRKALRGSAQKLAERKETLKALEYFHKLLELDPLDESAHRAVMRLEFARGNIQAALYQYESCCRILYEELASHPLAETNELAQLIRQGGTAFAESEAFEGKRMPPQLLRPPVLVGRESEWTHMEAAWQQGKAIFLAGEAGIGKSRLLFDFATSRGRYLLNEGRPGDVNVPFSSIARGLRRIRKAFPDISCAPWAAKALANIVPDLFPDTKPAPLDKTISTEQLIQANAWMIEQLAERVDALPSDDVHYFDDFSARIGEVFNAQWALKSKEHRLISAFRTSEMPAQTVKLIRAGEDRGMSTVLELSAMSLETTTAFLESLDMPKRQRFAKQLYHYTGGNPTFVIETLRELYQRDALEPDARHFEMSERIYSSIERRLGTLRPEALALLRAAAITQPYASLDLLAIILEQTPAEIADALGQLEAEQFLRGTRFVHDLLYEGVLAHAPTAITQLLHKRTAEALQAESGESVRIAYHFQEAGENERAVPYWLAAVKSYYAAGLRDNASELLKKLLPYVGVVERSELPPQLQDELEELVKEQ